MKKWQKQKDATVESTSTTGSPVPTAFEQMVVTISAMRKEAGLSPIEIVPKPKFEMPQWCGNIVKQLGKTILKPLLKLRPMGKVDWRNYGRMITIMERYRTFLIYDLPRIIEEELGDITEEQWKRVEPQLGLDNIRAYLIKVLNRPVADDEPLEKLADEVFERVFENLEKQKQTALYHVAQQNHKNTVLFYKGMAEGYELVIDEQAKFCGDRGRANIHMNLLSCMMDVEKIRRTLPPTTRSQYYDELVKVFKMTPKAYDWFNDVCDDIKFPLNNLGRKRRTPAVIL